MASRSRSNSKAANFVEKIKEKLSPTKVSPKRKRDDVEPSSLSDQRSTSPERPAKRLRATVDVSSESSQTILKSKGEKRADKDKTRQGKKSKKELKIEAERKRLEAFYNEKSNFFAQFDSFELKVQTAGDRAKEKKKGTMDPLDASLGDIEPDDADLDFLLASESSKPRKKRRSSRLQQQKEESSPKKRSPRKSGDKLPEAKKFFDTNIDALASSNIDGDFMSESSPKSLRRTSTRAESSSEREVEERLDNEAPDFEYEETPPVYNSASVAPSASRSQAQPNVSRLSLSRRGSKGDISVSTSMKAPVKPIGRKASSRQLDSSSQPSSQGPSATNTARVTRQSIRKKQGLENPELLEEYNDYLEEEHREGNKTPWTLAEYYEKVWKAAGFK